MVGIREALHHAVVGNGNGGMSPFVSAFYNILGFGNTVHVAHLGMTVQLHSLFHTVVGTCRGKIRDFFDTGNGADG